MEFDIERIAMLSFSNFGSTPHQQAEKVRLATELVKQQRPDLEIDGEMQADIAVVPELMQRHYPFSRCAMPTCWFSRTLPPPTQPTNCSAG